jgi:hypothetical protein
VFSLYITSVLRGTLRFLYKIDFLPIKKKKAKEHSEPFFFVKTLILT